MVVLVVVQDMLELIQVVLELLDKVTMVVTACKCKVVEAVAVKELLVQIVRLQVEVLAVLV
tara:strand:+ start:299 stop:481 length:183 start_codon:yes stop_codon:yes gene_type:complete